MEIRGLARSRREGGLSLPRALRYLALTVGLATTGMPVTSLAATGTSQYVYDDLGRLIQVIATDGSNVQYAYDAAGNIIGIKNNAVNTVAVAGFSPNFGDVGTVVVIQGSGFDAVPGNNTVLFNGQAATVTAATAASLTVTVPAGATSGTLSVSNANGTAASLASFSVGAANAAPAITSFSPAVVNTGSAVSVVGTAFRATPLTDNKVLLAGTRATVTAATSTALTFTAPAGTGGYVSVITPYGQATSASKLLIVPSGINAANVVTTGELVIDGATTALSIPAGKIGVYTFEALAGQALGLTLSNYVTTPSGGSVTVNIYSPNGALMSSCGTFTSINGCVGLISYPFVLPSTGTYKVIVQASSAHASSGTLTLSSAPTGTLTVDGPVTTITSSRMGQAPRYTFNATAGQTLTLGWSNNTYKLIGSIDLIIHRPNGTTLSTTRLPGSFGASGSIVISEPTFSGPHVLEVRPVLGGAPTGSIDVWLTSETSGTLAMDGTPTNISLSPGQKGSYAFNGTAGQAVGLVLSNYTSTPAGGQVAITIHAPNGTPAVSCGTFNSIKGCEALLAYPFTLPATGTYLVEVQASGAHTSTATLTLSSAPTGTLTVDGPATTITSSRMGQAPRYTFDATAGQSLTLGWSNNTYKLIGSIDLIIYRPDGYALSTTRLSGTSAATGSILIANPAFSGPHLLEVRPVLGGAPTGSIDVTLTSEAGGTLVMDGTPTAISLGKGQLGEYLFEGTAGQAVGLTLSNFVSTPSGGNVTLSVYAPNGDLFVSCGAFSSTKGCTNLIGYPLKLSATGTYRVVAVASAANAVSATLTLSSAPTGTLVIDAPASTLSVSRLGQAPRYTFDAVAGQTVTLGWSASTFSPSVRLSVYRPDGVLINYATVTSSSAGSWAIPAFVFSGPHTLVAMPANDGGVTGSISVSLTGTGNITPPSYTPTGVLNLDGTPTSISLAAGQQGIYTFSGTVGQAVGLVLSNYASSPAGGNVSITTQTPEGAPMNTCGTFNSNKGCENLIGYPFKLPTTGTYKVLVQASASQASTATLTLSSAPTGTLTVDGPATTITSSRMGQAPRYTFNATAGQSLTLGWSNNTYMQIGSIDLIIYRPDGYALSTTRLSPTSSPTGSILIANPVFSGPHVLEVRPILGGVTTGSIDISVTSQANGTLVMDGTPTTISLGAGQEGIYTFNGTAGQAVGLVVSNYASTPAGGNVSITLKSPQGVGLLTCGTFNSTSGCEGLIAYPYKLHTTGTYQVVVQASGTHASTATLTLSSAPTGTLTVDGPATTITSSRMGQAPRYTFNATAGETLTLGWSNNTYKLIGSIDAIIYRPDGYALSTTRLPGSFGEAGSILIPNPVFSGPHLLEVRPIYGGVTTGSLDVTVKSTVTGTLTTDGSISTVTLGQSQAGRYTFEGVAGQKLKLQIASIATTPAGGAVSLSVTSPQGVAVVSCSSAFTEDRWFNCDMDLPATGTYAVDLDAGAAAATFDLAISPRNFAGK